MSRLTRRSLLAGLGATALPLPRAEANTQATMTDLGHLTPEQRARHEAYRARMMAALPYERISVPGEQALVEWGRLKAAGRGYPILIGSDEDLERVADHFSISDPSVSGAAFGSGRPRSPAFVRWSGWA